VFARRAGWDLAASPLAALAAERAKRGLPLLDLTLSNPTQVGLEAPGEALAAALADLAPDPALRRYAPDPRGDAAARATIAADHAAHGFALAPEHVILTAGTSEGYAHLFRLLADPGERVHLPSPGYGLFEHLARLEGLEVSHYRLVSRRGEARWRIDLAALEASLDARSRALVVIHPHNPTGSLLDPEDLAALRALGRARGLALISDEVFADSAAAGARFVSALAGAEAGPLHFGLSGASKRLGLPQLKLAWIAVAGPAAARDEALARLEFIADAYLSVSPLLARTLPGLLAQREALSRPLALRAAANRARLAALDAAGPLAALPAEAGWAAILRVRGAALDEEALALGLLERAGVLVQPGFLFDLEPEPDAAQLVLSLLPEPAAFARGLEALAAFVAELA
jgi:aspartate/methionine/tyrosine aminotransferase